MKTFTNTLLTAGLVLGSVAMLGTGPALAAVPMPSLTASVAAVSDYRFRGVSQSNEDAAIQGSLGASLEGFYVGTWASSIAALPGGATSEFDLYGGWGTTLANGLGLDLGFLEYVYPGGDNTNYYELHATVNGAFQALSWSVGANYNPKQDNLGHDDDLYLQGAAKYALPNTPLYVGAHFGWENGALGNPDGLGGDTKLDWSASVGVKWQAWDVSVSYVDTDQHCDNCDATAVVSVGASF